MQSPDYMLHLIWVLVAVIATMTFACIWFWAESSSNRAKYEAAKARYKALEQYRDNARAMLAGLNDRIYRQQAIIQGFMDVTDKATAVWSSASHLCSTYRSYNSAFETEE